MANTGRAVRRLAPFVLGAAGLVMLLLAASSFVGSSGFGYDYAAYDAAARRLAEGGPLYPPGTAEAYNSGAYANLYLYPPPLAVWLIPLTALTPGMAALVWLAARIVALVAAVLILPISNLARGATLLVAALSFPVWYDLNLGNLSIVLFALSAVIWRFDGRPASWLALAVSGLVRYPFAIVGLGWIVRRAWRSVTGTIVAGLALVAITLVVVGIGGWVDYVGVVRALGNVSAGEHNLSFATTAAAVGLPPSPAWVALGIVIAVAATVWAAARRDPETAVVTSLAATVLCFPFFHPHYLVQLLIPAAFLAKRGQWWGLVLPLLGWLPGESLPAVAALACVAPLLPPRFLAFSPAAAPPAPPFAVGRLDAGAGS